MQHCPSCDRELDGKEKTAGYCDSDDCPRHDKHWNAVLAKNLIARELKQYLTREGGFLAVDYIMERLREIEAYIGTANLPSVDDELNSQY